MGDLIDKPNGIPSAPTIKPMSEWGAECGRGFCSDARFSGGKDRVIKRTNRAVTRKWHKLENKTNGEKS